MSEKDATARVETELPSFVAFGHHDTDTPAGVADLAEATKDAQRATDEEHELTVMQAVKLYPRAIICSMTLSFAIIMEGYDTSLLGSFCKYYFGSKPPQS